MTYKHLQILYRLVLIGLILGIQCYGVCSYAEKQGPPTNAQKPTLDPALTKVNRSFHLALKEEFEREREALGPAIFFEKNILKLVKNGQIIAEEKASPTITYHQVKAYSHMCMTVVIKLLTVQDENKRRIWASEFIKDVDVAQSVASTLGLSPELTARQIALSSLTFNLLKEAQGTAFTSKNMNAYIKDIKPLVISNFKVAAADHISQLDLAAEKLMKHLKPGERERLQSFTYGSRSPRADNLITQYLAYLMGERSLAESERVVYAEGISGQKKVFDLIAKYNLELALGIVLFNDANRLQRDVLADSTREILIKRAPNKLTEPASQRLLKDRFNIDLKTVSPLK